MSMLRAVVSWNAAAGCAALLALPACHSPENAASKDTMTSSTATPPRAPGRLAYPETRKVEQVDDYHGTKVADPYRWLESIDSPETEEWIAAQNKVTESWLSALPGRARLVQRLTDLYNYERRGVMGKVNGVLFFSRNPGLQPQSVVFKQGPGDAKPVVLLDPNELSKDGTVALSGFSPSEDARYVAYATSDGGSDWMTWHVRDLVTLADTADRLVWCKFSGAAWAHDNSGFWYCRFPEPRKGDELEQANRNHKLYFHRLGDPQEKDRLVYERPDQPEWLFRPVVSDDGRYLVIDVSQGTDRRNRVYCQDLQTPDAPIVKLLDDFDAGYNFVGSQGTVFYFHTDLDAPRSRVIAIDVANPARAAWREIVPTAADQLNSASTVNGQLVLNYLHDASTRIRFFHLDGRLDRDFELPGIGTAGGFGGRIDDTDTFYTFTSFTSPPTIYHYDFKTGRSEQWFTPRLNFDFKPYETRLVFAKSRDGTKVPIHVTCRRDVKLDGRNPCLLYGYGGFNIPMTPSFSTQRLAWLERGGVYAQAILRGGSEYGESWHQAGMLGNKQNVFDDFIAAAEHLIATGWTSTPKLAIQGGSNGGLLVGACLAQRPELFGAAIPAVGVLDMLRYHLFTIGAAWAPEYGRADDAEQFRWLVKYSPLHTLQPGRKYPPTLILTGDHDDRVMPAHSFKFAAALQAAQGGSAPTLIRIETRAGHGAGKPTKYVIEEQADVYAFLLKTLGA